MKTVNKLPELKRVLDKMLKEHMKAGKQLDEITLDLGLGEQKYLVTVTEVESDCFIDAKGQQWVKAL